MFQAKGLALAVVKTLIIFVLNYALTCQSLPIVITQQFSVKLTMAVKLLRAKPIF